MQLRSNDPPEFARLVVGSDPSAGQELGLLDGCRPVIFQFPDHQPRSVFGFGIDNQEVGSRHGDDDAGQGGGEPVWRMQWLTLFRGVLSQPGLSPLLYSPAAAVSALSPWPTASSTTGRGTPTVVGTLKVTLGMAGDGIAAPVGTRALFSMATAMATSVALTQATGGILVRTTYRVTRR